MDNSLANRIKYALQQNNVVDLDARGFATGTTLTINSCKMVGNKIVADVTSSDNSTGNLAITVPFGFTVIGGHVISGKSVTDATVTLKNGSHAISNAVAFAADKALINIGTIDDDYNSLDEGDTLNIAVLKNTSTGLVVIDIIPN